MFSSRKASTIISLLRLSKFYLNNVAWADQELFHLGPVVAASKYITNPDMFKQPITLPSRIFKVPGPAQGYQLDSSPFLKEPLLRLNSHVSSPTSEEVCEWEQVS